jgi:hypothetical protein
MLVMASAAKNLSVNRTSRQGNSGSHLKISHTFQNIFGWRYQVHPIISTWFGVQPNRMWNDIVATKARIVEIMLHIKGNIQGVGRFGGGNTLVAQHARGTQR